MPRKQHPDLRESLLSAVEALLRERGIEGLSLREVARRAGASPAAPGYHFGTRAGMLTAFAARGFVDLAEAATEEVARSGARTPAERLAALGRGYTAFAVSFPGRWDVMFRSDLLVPDDPELAAAIARPRGLLLDAVRDGARSGLLAPADVEEVAIAAWSLTHGLAGLWISGRLRRHWGQTDVERLSRRVTDRFVAAVLRPGAHDSESGS